MSFICRVCALDSSLGRWPAVPKQHRHRRIRYCAPRAGREHLAQSQARQLRFLDSADSAHTHKRKMPGVLSSLGVWWRWRMRRSQVHLPPIIVFRTVGTVVAIDGGYFRVELPDGRSMSVMANPWIADVNIGDRVEFEPSGSSIAGWRTWILVRKLDPQLDQLPSEEHEVTKTTSGAALVFMICAATALVGSSVQRNSVQSERLNPRIGPANSPRYRTIRDVKDWKNPYLVIRRDGIQVIATDLPSGPRTIAPTDLQRALVELPVSAWPYGRVAVVQEIGIGAADRSDDKSIADNLAAALAILKALNVKVERWPA